MSDQEAAVSLSVIVVNYNQKYFPKMCLEALAESETDFSYEILFVDNGSTDESIDFLRDRKKQGRIRLIESGKNLGYGQANNLGAKKARGEYLLIMNPDVSVHPETLRIMAKYLRANEDIGILGPKIVYHNGKVQESCRRFMTFSDLVIKRTFLKKLSPFRERLTRYIMKDIDNEKIQDVDLLVGACFMIPRAIFEELGGFDKRYFLFMEDFDLCQKAHKARYRVVYFPATTVTHYHKRLSDGSLFRVIFQKVFWYHLVSSAKYFWRWRKVKHCSSNSD